MLGQALLEQLGEHALAGFLPGACRARLDMPLHLVMRGGLEGAALVVEQSRSHVPALHSASYLA